MTTVFTNIGAALSRVWKALSPDVAKAHRDSAYERYLSEATDVYDLEARERAWDRKMQHRNLY